MVHSVYRGQSSPIRLHGLVFDDDDFEKVWNEVGVSGKGLGVRMNVDFDEIFMRENG